jgi:hypothetical protein
MVGGSSNEWVFPELSHLKQSSNTISKFFAKLIERLYNNWREMQGAALEKVLEDCQEFDWENSLN